mgnify:CR=1 FL=1
MTPGGLTPPLGPNTAAQRGRASPARVRCSDSLPGVRTPLRPAWLGLLLTACSSNGADTTSGLDTSSSDPGTSFPSSGAATALPTSTDGTGTPTSTDATGTSTAMTASSGEPVTSTDPGTSTDLGSTGTDSSSTDSSSTDSSSSEPSTTGTDTSASSSSSGGVDCGDGILGPGEGCDDGNADNTDGCTELCTLPVCGDGFVQPGNGELCDDGVDNDDSAACLASCKPAKCGDGLVWVGVEACDDANADETDACTAACKAPTCMDGKKNGGETGLDCGGPTCSACPMLLLLGGNATKMLGARYDGFAWTSADIAAPAVDPVDITVTSEGVGVGVFRYTKLNDPKDQQLQHVLYKNGAWTAPTAIGPTLTRAAPTLSTADKGAHLVFQGTNFQFYYAGFSGAVWGPAAEMLGSFGPGPGSVATLGADAVYVFHDGAQNNNLNSRVRNPVWQPQQLIDTQTSFTDPPVLVAPGGMLELLEVHTLNANDQIRFSVRKAGVWSATANLVGAITPHPPALAALPGGKVILAMRAADSRIYTTTYDPGANLWSGLAVVNVNPISDRPPAVAAGIPGAEVELVYLDSATKTPRHVRLNKGSWSAPAVAGPTALDNVAIATGP